ncbi:MAG: phosphoglycerate mutase (2,3-diphosphoglycerate-independent) [Phycisphaeraceae bacterium]|nr:phosphoglycerate mutase (2,3-diphosphoglycerate-independent) [Phycisphaeraceae bacterium]
MSDALHGPVILIVRDGWGRNPNPDHHEFNAIELAATPRCDALLRSYPWTLIRTSGEDVGLPDRTMGNSEVGHQNLGAGRIVDQESVRITRALREGRFEENAALVDAMKHGRRIHLMGLASDAGVHGLLTHLYGCLDVCRRHERPALVHLFTDGRDTGPFTGVKYVREVVERCRENGGAQVASLCGRYYAMDRDYRWERVAQGYDLLTGRRDDLPAFDDAVAAMQDYYDAPRSESQRGDEFVTPRYVGDWRESRIRDGDAVIFYNFRGDRPREITRAFVLPEFLGHVPPSPDTGTPGFDRGPKLDVRFVTMTAYERELDRYVQVAFPKPPKMQDITGAFLADRGLCQFRAAESEKFPHVTFFFNDYRDEPFEGETQAKAPSPQVQTYDLKPEMSAEAVTELVLGRMAADDCEPFILVNYANGDMVGHTGDLDAAIRAIQTVDECVGRVVDAALERGGASIVTADHGNAEQMFDPDSEAPHTAHTTYDVECIIVDPRSVGMASGDADRPSKQLRHGRLADVMPTVLQMMGLEAPGAMTGRSLIRSGA